MAGGGGFTYQQRPQYDYSTFSGGQNVGPESTFLSPVHDATKYTSQQKP